MFPPTLEESISVTLNQTFQIRGITATVTSKGRVIKVILESSEIPEPESTTALVRYAIARLEIKSMAKVKVLAKQRNSFDIAWGREFELEAEPESFAMSEPEVEVGGSRSKKVSPDEFQQALEESTKTAKIAYQKTFNYYQEIAALLKTFKLDLNQNISRLLKQNNIHKFNFINDLKNISDEIEKYTNEELKELRNSLDIKRQHLSDFTIVLFGRTKAGKSTIREALTCGDGSTIGTGSQRTTRDIREYRWKGLRLIDTPGIEAYQGNEDKQKALEIVYESDIVIFLTSDDSVQPGEFDAMGWLQEIKKFFFVILNIKANIDNSKRLERFIRNPDKVFDAQRLEEHKHHIRNYVEQSLNLKDIQISCIHAYAAFLSNQPQYDELSETLWRLSRIEEVYSLIVSEIYTRGKQRRWNTFFDAIIYFLDSIIITLNRHQEYLLSQVSFMQEKQAEVENIFKDNVKNGKAKIARQCRDSFSKIKQWIPAFVDEYLGKDIAQAEYQKRMNREKEKIEIAMEGLFEEIVQELVVSLNEFQRQYQYDMGTIKLETTNFDKYQQFQVGKILKWVSVGLGTVSAVALGIGTFAAANFWNPVGWVAAATSIAVGLFGYFFDDHEKKAWQKAKQEAKETLWKSLTQSEQQTCETYQRTIDTNIAVRAKAEVLEPIDIYIKEILIIVSNIKKIILKLENIKREMKRESQYTQTRNSSSYQNNFHNKPSIIPDELL
ncbi:GTPase [Anabaena azotica]|uniref:50S ribosome-binding GTPase n=1 Tax=Anabaena azotica FACHB-119 TaxID=947527 RepID=A0ABR8DDV0_9NOST|nr:GTPase [Anabaena azotica]MBD2505244.1 50S ribosome-binding GTPase [Anabaena azotica FACHB-119]